MLKKIRQFFKEYKQLGFVVISLIVGIALDLAGQDKWSHIVLGGSALISVVPLLWGMWEDLRDGSYGIDVLAATAIVTSVLLHEYWAGMVIVLMLTGGEALEDYAESRAKRELSSLLANKPKKTTVIRGKKTLEVKVSEVVVGDKVVIVPGQVVPVDGVIIEGSTSIDESSLTGESLPLARDTGDQIMSGSINMEGSITIQAQHTAADSQYEQIIKLVKSASASQSPFVRLADRYSIPFTVLSFLIAGSVWFVSGDPVRFLEVLVVATPCPLLLGAPIALISGMSRAAKHGIIVKTGSALERLAEVETIAFDKTGTLTQGTPKVDGVKTYNKFSKANVLYYAAALEQGSNHVLAKAIVEAAAKDNAKLNPAKQVQEKAGHGLSGRLQGKTILVGRAMFLEESGVGLPEGFSNKSKRQTESFVAVDGTLAGVISFSDELRSEAKDLLRHLKRLRVKHTLMVTGDNQPTADAIAKQLGIERVVADCLPGDKIRALEAVKNRPVAFVGDGVNDAPVLTASDVGIALGARGSTAASESADVVIMTDDIMKVASSVAIAKRTFYIGKQSILIGIFISIALMGVFATGRFKAVQGAAIQELVDITVILNALRAHRSGGKLKTS
jgi:heavy metal translocating P-type ATPase